MKRSVLIASVAIVAFVSGLSVRGLLSSPLETPNQPATQVALPDVSMADLAGKQHNFKEWQGKVLVINFWATWCPPCLKEMPEFEALQNDYAKKGLQIVGIALDDADPVKEFINSKKITYPILLGADQGTKIAHDLGNIVNTVPFTVIINKQGQVVKSHMGTFTKEELSQLITPLI